MTPKEYAEKRAAEGVGTTKAAEELCEITGSCIRAVYGWLEKDSRPPAVCRLLAIWQTLTPAEKSELLRLPLPRVPR